MKTQSSKHLLDIAKQTFQHHDSHLHSNTHSTSHNDRNHKHSPKEIFHHDSHPQSKTHPSIFTSHDDHTHSPSFPRHHESHHTEHREQHPIVSNLTKLSEQEHKPSAQHQDNGHPHPHQIIQSNKPGHKPHTFPLPQPTSPIPDHNGLFIAHKTEPISIQSQSTHVHPLQHLHQEEHLTSDHKQSLFDKDSVQTPGIPLSNTENNSISVQTPGIPLSNTENNSIFQNHFPKPLRVQSTEDTNISHHLHQPVKPLLEQSPSQPLLQSPVHLLTSEKQLFDNSTPVIPWNPSNDSNHSIFHDPEHHKDSTILQSPTSESAHQDTVQKHIDPHPNDPDSFQVTGMHPLNSPGERTWGEMAKRGLFSAARGGQNLIGAGVLIATPGVSAISSRLWIARATSHALNAFCSRFP